jgi:hypothetical protein
MKLEVYSPSNSTENDAFQSKWCVECKFFTKRHFDDVMDCSKKMIFYAMIGESKWLYNTEGEPFCPKFKNRNEKPKPRHNRKNKNQLCLF